MADTEEFKLLVRSRDANILIEEMADTKPLSVVLAEKVQALRHWAEGRCVFSG